VNWDSLADLASYALLGIVPHAAIEPFRYIASRYHPQERAEWDAVFFDDPVTYLHVSEAGEVALTRSDLREGRFLAPSPDKVTAETRNQAMENRRWIWHQFFLERARCASCEGWRLCRGRFAAQVERNPSCSKFFVELLDVIDRHKKAQARPGEQWQF
jgi:hypothetical protein